MKSEILSQERNVVVVKAEYEAPEVDRAINRTVRDLSNKANIKGFRRGHVPRKTLELFFGKNGIYREALEHLAGEALESVVSEYDLDLVAEPKAKLDEIAEGKPLSMEFTFEVRPEVTLPDISELSAEKVVYGVEDAEVDEAFGQILESNAKLEPVDEDRPATKDDIVETEYTSYAAGEDGEQKVLEENQKSTLMLATLRPDIADAIIGHRLAEEFSFEITLEEDYPDARMAGTTIRYEMEILQFMKRVVPEATDENISTFSKGKYSTIDELKTELRRQLEENAAERSMGTLRESAIKALAAASEVDVPESMIDRQYTAMRREQDGTLQRDLKQSLEEYLKNNNLSVDEFDGNLKKKAEEIVRNTLVLDALAERDNINFTSDELNEEIMRMASSMRVNPQELADSLGKNREEFTSMAMRVRSRNTINHLASLVKVVEVEPKQEADAPVPGESEAASPEEAPKDSEE